MIGGSTRQNNTVFQYTTSLHRLLCFVERQWTHLVKGKQPKYLFSVQTLEDELRPLDRRHPSAVVSENGIDPLQSP